MKGHLVVVQIVVLIPLGIKLCFVLRLEFQSHGFYQSLMSVGLEKCSLSYRISVSQLGRRWLEHNCPGDLRERLIKLINLRERLINTRLLYSKQGGQTKT